jgi:membrane associated rhomboid family serine protease
MLWLPLRIDVSLALRPWANWAILGATAAAFLGQRFAPEWSDRYCLASRDPRLGDLVTYAFLHLNLLHLGGNLLALAIFGNHLNDRLGHVGYPAFYLAGAVVAGAAFVAFSPGGAVVGASGATAAVMGGYLVLLPRSRLTLLAGLYTIQVPALVFILVYFLLNVTMALLAEPTVAYAAHLAGLVFGFGLCLLLARAGLLPRQGSG